MGTNKSGHQAWSVGEVAETSGITVRTLHHWDEIGLLRPARSGAGRREYGPDDLFRLYLILALRGLGLDLESVRHCLDAEVDPRRVLRDQLDAIEQAEQALGVLRGRLESVLAGTGDEPDPVDLLRVLRAAHPDRASALERYLSVEELDGLNRAGADLGPRAQYVIEIEFPQLYRRVEELRRQEVPADDDRVQGLIARMDALSALLGGRDGAGAGVRRAWREDPAAMSGQDETVAGPWRELADYVEAARAVKQSRI
jgi:DNA-binding transcriptional MerR regulator